MRARWVARRSRFTVAIAVVAAVGALPIVASSRAAAEQAPVAIADSQPSVACDHTGHCWALLWDQGGAVAPISGGAIGASMPLALASPVLDPITQLPIWSCGETLCVTAGYNSTGVVATVIVENGVPRPPVAAPDDSFFPWAADCGGTSCTVVGSGGSGPSRGEAVVVDTAGTVSQGMVTSVNAFLAVDCFATGECVASAQPSASSLQTELVELVNGNSTSTSATVGTVIRDLECSDAEDCIGIGFHFDPSQNRGLGDAVTWSGGSLDVHTIPGQDTTSSFSTDNTFLHSLVCSPDLSACDAVGTRRANTASPINRGIRWQLQHGTPEQATEYPAVESLASIGCTSAECIAFGGTSTYGGFSVAAPWVAVAGLPTPLPPSDSEPPSASVVSPSDGYVAAVDEPVSLSLDCHDDGGSGLAGCNAVVEPGGTSVASGGLLPTATPGAYTVTATAVDSAGNHGSAVISYVVAAGSKYEDVSGGGTVSTGTTATSDVPVQTQLTAPSSVSGAITVVPEAASSDPDGFALFDQQVMIEGPPATTDDPYEVTFLVDSSAFDGVAPTDIEVFRNGARVIDCTDATKAQPDPCIVSRGYAPDRSGDAVVRARTSHFSTWSLGLRTTPLALDDAFTTPQARALHVPGPGVLANDKPIATGDPLAATLVAGPNHGTVSVAADGGFVYTPAPTFVGSDQFTYSATGSGSVASRPATVSVTVTPRTATVLHVDPVLIKRISLLGVTVSIGTVTARLTTATGAALAGETVAFTTKGRPVCTATSSASGTATCSASLTTELGMLLALGVTAKYDGSDSYFGAQAHNGLIG